MENIQIILDKLLHIQVVGSIIVIIISFSLYRLLVYLLGKGSRTKGLKILDNQKRETFFRMTKSVVRYIMIIITILILLQINGINVSSLLAGVGIVGIVIGFAIQDALKDIIKGFDIITDSYYHVGDVIKFGDIEGKVLAIGLKTTRIEDVRTFNIISIANRNIEQVEIVSHLINLDIPMSYEVALDDAEKAIGDILEKVKQLKNVEKCEYRGVDNLAESRIEYQIKVYCAPILKVQMRRDVLRCVLVGLKENHIAVPYNQIDVHQK